VAGKSFNGQTNHHKNHPLDYFFLTGDRLTGVVLRNGQTGFATGVADLTDVVGGVGVTTFGAT